MSFPLPCRTASLIKSGKLADLSVEDTQRNYKKALEKGVLKILSKMGISLLSCYHGAQIFEIYGLGQDIVDTAFRGSVSRIGGMTFDDLQKEVESFWVKVSALVFTPPVEKSMFTVDLKHRHEVCHDCYPAAAVGRLLC